MGGEPTGGICVKRADNFSYGRIVLLGTGFGTVVLAWSLYNAFIPLYLEQFLASDALIGFIMTLDNIAAITLIPVFGAWSDRVRTRVGRRMPFILIGMPVAAITFGLLTRFQYFWLFIALDVVFTVAMSAVRAPAVALMPDLTPPEKRSNANGIINFLGGVGGALAHLFGGMLYDQDPRLPFLLGAAVLLAAPWVLAAFIREPAAERRETPSSGSDGAESAEHPPLLKTLRSLRRMEDKTLRLLMALLFAFAGFAAVETFFTLYATEVLGWTGGEATQSLIFVSGTLVLGAVPAGLAATRIGRKRAIQIGMFVFTAALLAVAFVSDPAPLRALFVAAGAGWALIVVSAYPIVVARAPEGQTGAYTGLYYLFTSAAAIASPLVVGQTMDLLGRQSLFYASAVLVAVAIWLFWTVPDDEASARKAPAGASALDA